MELKEFSTDDLANELAKRNDLLDENGMMSNGAYAIFTKIAVIPCTDGVPVRRNEDGAIEAMAIERGTGPFKGRWCSVGGRLTRGERFEDCLKRQFRSDLNCEITLLVPWSKPVAVAQFYPLENALTDEPPRDFFPEQKRHTISCYYPVLFLSDPKPGGETAHGGVEARKIEWFSLANLPGPEHFGYGQHAMFLKCMDAAEKLI